MNYFFVFQNKSYIGEYKGNFLWAPEFDDNGHKKSFWESMKNVEAGDVIFSSVDNHGIYGGVEGRLLIN